MSSRGILVIGGCGCSGYHIVRALVDGSLCSSVHIMSRNPTMNIVDGAVYHAGDISSVATMKRLLDEIEPVAIIHTASPQPQYTSSKKDFMKSIVEGTQNLLDCAAASPSVRVFVYTSTTSVMEGGTQDFVSEDAPVKTTSSRAHSYGIAKALADQAVLKANGTGGLKTACLRLPSVHGERDNQCIPGAIEALKAGHNKYQIGDNTALYDTVSVDNLAVAHLLALQALSRDLPQDPDLKVEGEAFFITDGKPINFWTLMRKIWSAAGDTTPPEQVRVVPAPLVLFLASVIEWMYWIFTFGRKAPRVFNGEIMEYTCLNKTFSIEKARKRLGYEPKFERDYQIKKGVEWALAHEKKA